jgi:uncharacterized protein (TIGR03118 family)
MIHWRLLSSLMNANLIKVSLATALLSGVVGAAAPTPGYLLTLTESDLAHTASHQDVRLVNPWGVVHTATELVVADNGTGLLTFYSPMTGARINGSITVPPPAGSTNSAAPSGLVLNSDSAFVLTNGAHHQTAVGFIATEDGTVSGWNSKNEPTLLIDNSATGAVYKGIAIAGTSNGPVLFVTDFHNGFVAAYNSHYAFLGNFTDPALVNLGFAPFGIRMIQDKLIVTFAKQNAERHDDVAGPGNGYIDIFNTSGELVRQFAANGALNSPWGLAVAPKQFGIFGFALLVGNFGDGTINAYNLLTGEYLGALADKQGNTISVNGLWGLTFDVDPSGDELEYIASRLYITAGLNHEADGALGNIKANSPMLPPMH